jgi:hypothetical protein
MINIRKFSVVAFLASVALAQFASAAPQVVDTNSKRHDAARAEALANRDGDSMMAGMKAELMDEAESNMPVDTNAKRFDSARAEALKKSKRMAEERAQLNLDAEESVAAQPDLGVVDTNPKRFDAARALAESK